MQFKHLCWFESKIYKSVGKKFTVHVEASQRLKANKNMEIKYSQRCRQNIHRNATQKFTANFSIS